MSEERCFCHLNGYAVKDATARRELENKVSHAQLTEAANTLNNAIQNISFRQGGLETQIAQLGVPRTAGDLPFVNEGTSLISQDTQGAIEEVNAKVDGIAIPDASRVAFDGTDSGLTSSNVQDAIGEVLAKAGTVRYDKETDTLFVLKDGEWIETTLRCNTENMSLYVDGVDYADFVAYAGGVGETDYGETVTTPTLTKSGEMIVELINPNDSYMRGCVISGVVDFTGYSELKFNHTSSAGGGNGVTQSQLIIVQTKQTQMTPVTSLVLTQASTKPNVTNEDVTIDISELSGEYYIAVYMRMYGKVTVKTSIKNMYLE